jgi:energy-coupling factor transporter ATP-binding protein EcfA2
MGSFVLLSGASGAGKTTIARSVENLRPPNCEVHFFDSIGVPSVEQMHREFGHGHEPGGAWQRAMTLQWIGRIRTIWDRGISVLLEGQMRIAFIREALAENQITSAHVILAVAATPQQNQRPLQKGPLNQGIFASQDGLKLLYH